MEGIPLFIKKTADTAQIEPAKGAILTPTPRNSPEMFAPANCVA